MKNELEEKKELENKKVSILLLDIETFPNVGYSWGKWEQNIIEFLRNWYVLCFAYKWVGEKKINVVALSDFRGYKPGGDDRKLVERLKELLDRADIVIAHNGKKFDIKKINTRFIQYGITPPSPYLVIDTLQIARQNFSFNSNKLDDLGRDLGIGRKMEHEGFPLWLRCADGDKKAWYKMKKYNKMDIILLEKLYLKERPWLKNNINLDVFSPITICPKCGSSNLQSRGQTYSKNMTYHQYYCKDCHGWSRHVKGIRKSFLKGI